MTDTRHLKKPSRKLRTRLFHWFFLFKRPMTLGVRAIIRDDEARLLLVRHSYVPGWHLPGGGVERGETVMDALRKELREEAAIERFAAARLLGAYRNLHASKRDHVLLYEVEHWERGRFQQSAEILEASFFPIDALPEGTTEATRRRIRELTGKAEPSEYW